jgi:hypothetical protein
MPDVFQAGEKVPTTGVYKTVHAHEHVPPHYVTGTLWRRTLLQSRMEYIEWVEFYYWVRSITETVDHIQTPSGKRWAVVPDFWKPKPNIKTDRS